MTGDNDDHGPTDQPPWHHSTPAVVGASVVALAAIALLVWAVVALTSSADKPEQAPIEFVPPTYASTTSKTSTTTTTPTITSTSPPVTSEIGPTDAPGPPIPSSTSGTSESSTSVSRIPPHTRTESSDGEDDESSTSTTRNRPRTNVTRTLYPAPGN